MPEADLVVVGQIGDHHASGSPFFFLASTIETRESAEIGCGGIGESGLLPDLVGYGDAISIEIHAESSDNVVAKPIVAPIG